MNISPDKLRSLNRLSQWAVLIATINPKNNIFPYLNVDGSDELKGPYPGSLFVKGKEKSRYTLGYLPGANKMGGVPEHIDNLAAGLIGASKGPDKVLAKISNKLGVALSPRELTKKDDYVPKDPKKSGEEKPDEKTMKGTGSTSENQLHIFNDLLSEAASDLLDSFLESGDLKPKAARIISMLAIMYAADGEGLSIGNPGKLKPKTKKELENFGFVFNQQNNIYIFGGDSSDNKDDNKNDKNDEEEEEEKTSPSSLNKKRTGINLDYGTAGSKITEKIILSKLIK
tara:strand:+ start:50 stop:904 length:855 start_codon:yes stop_codon:yes gene_type:complete